MQCEYCRTEGSQNPTRPGTCVNCGAPLISKNAEIKWPTPPYQEVIATTNTPYPVIVINRGW